MPAYQFTGKGEDVITLDGTIVPEFGSQLSLTALRLMGDTSKSFPLIAGNGKIYGLWVLKSVNETQSYFFKDGTPRKIEFTLTLEKTTTAGVLIGNVLGSVLEGVL
ncbi:phage tail protein [Acinetobacter baumannii]|nr:phage tail protein [Acinetobacter baumannii]